MDRTARPNAGLGTQKEIVHAKWRGHEINNTTRFIAPPRPMYSIGG